MRFLSKKALRESLKIIPIDFARPWWSLMIDQKWRMLIITLASARITIFWNLTPFFITRVLELRTIESCLLLFSAWVFVDFLYTYSRQLNAQFQLQCIHSIYQNAHQYLLTVDPRYHVHRSSGAVLGKIDRAARGYEDLLDQITFEFTPLCAGLITMLIAIGAYSYFLAAGIAVFFVVMILIGYYFARYVSQQWEKGFIVTDDSFRSTAVENLTLVQLVRATFASDYISDRLTHKIYKNMQTEGNLWLAYTTSTFILNMLYLCALFCVISVLVWQLNQGITSLASAVGLVVAYIQSTKQLVLLAKPFRRYMRGWAAVKDLFEFIPAFGKPGFPVLGASDCVVEQQLKSQSTIELQARTIAFDYETAQLFNNHTLVLSCEQNAKNKLYGIIGPSGSGKTTLLSIVGGQLKPIAGTVLLNGLDIYSIPDAGRRCLIALQGQIATTARGTVKYNLLFGLPNDHGFDDNYILEVLERVGLRTILGTHHGLATMLGEAGLNLSGGQRQRLNFAGHIYEHTIISRCLYLLMNLQAAWMK